MGTLTIYAIKSSITLALLYLPYALLLRKDTFFRFNRMSLLAIIVLSLVVPCLDIPIWHNPFAEPLQQQKEALQGITLPTLIVDAEGENLVAHASSLGRGWGTFVLMYIIGMLLCLGWKIVSLVRLIRFVGRGCLWIDHQESATIYCHAGRVAPFSWMRSVVVGESDVRTEESVCTSGVLTHELAHVRLRHSWDVVFISLVEVLQWFNPCIWMLDASLREVHEYEADDTVLRRGISACDYQLLLIEKAVAGTRYPMANAFNHSLLKNRITMMNKQKSPRWARLKVLYAVPVILIAIGAFASGRIEEKVKPLTFINQKRVTEAEVKQLDQAQIAHIEVLKPETAMKVYGVEEGKDGAVLITTENGKLIHVKPGTLRLVVDGKEMTEHEAVKAVQGKEIKETVSMKHDGSTEVQVATSEPDDEPVVEKPEVMPEFPGGMNEMFGWLMRNVKYPQEAAECGVQGRVLVKFDIEKDGSLSNIKVVKGMGDGGEVVVTAYKAQDETPEEVSKENLYKARIALQDEAVRVVKAMPNWKPGTVGGKPVRVQFTLPISFRLN